MPKNTQKEMDEAVLDWVGDAKRRVSNSPSHLRNISNQGVQMSFHAELVNTVSFLVDEGKPYRLFLEMAGEKEPWVTESVQTWGDGFISFDAVNGTVVTLKTAHIISFWVKSGE